jgi:protein arginine kinase activator
MADTPEMESEFEPEDKVPDRPIECGECKKPIAVRYTEIIKGTINEISMCADCPHLQRHLCGMGSPTADGETVAKTGVACGDCGTTLESILVGHPLGCPHCYEVFTDTIIEELEARNKLPIKEETARKTLILHIGRAPGETVEMSPSLRLIALNEALMETLKREDYEQAALLRDQINALTEDGSKEKREKKK